MPSLLSSFDSCINFIPVLERFVLDGFLAQTPGGTSWVDTIRGIDTGKLTILLVFGTGIIYALGFALTSAIRAINSSPDDTDELVEKIESLKQRVEAIEQHLHQQ